MEKRHLPTAVLFLPASEKRNEHGTKSEKRTDNNIYPEHVQSENNNRPVLNKTNNNVTIITYYTK